MAQPAGGEDKRIVEHWRLDDVQAAHDAAPETFPIAPLEERQNLQPGRRVRLHFRFDRPAGDGCEAERLWVTITGKSGETFRGTLDGEPAYIRSLSAGAPIAFNVRHIAQILIARTDPRWLDVRKKAVVSKRVIAERRVDFAYREAPNNADDSGWVVWAGGEDEEFSRNSANFQLISLEQLLAIDKSLERIFKSEVGSAFERPAGAQEFQRIDDWKPGE